MTLLDNPILFLATGDANRCRAFYDQTLRLDFVADEPAALVFRVGQSTLRIQKVEQVHAAPYTALGWEVGDICQVVGQLRAAGVEFLHFEGMSQDDDGIWKSPSGALVAWLKDPDGNVLSLTQIC